MRRQFHAQRPNQLWVCDLTYIRTWVGFAYLALVIDGQGCPWVACWLRAWNRALTPALARTSTSVKSTMTGRGSAGYTQVPIVAVNRAVAVAEVHGPAVALAALEGGVKLPGYHLLPAARADLLAPLGGAAEATAAYAEAIALAGTDAERTFSEPAAPRRADHAGPRGPGSADHARPQPECRVPGQQEADDPDHPGQRVAARHPRADPVQQRRDPLAQA